MHMLHVPDRALVLSEMRRVRSPDRVVLVLANSDEHLHEFKTLVRRAAGIALPSSGIRFKMETRSPSSTRCSRTPNGTTRAARS